VTPRASPAAQPAYAAILSGIVASFLIPLFLSIAKSPLVNEVVTGKNYAENMFILFAFCLLAATSARTFVDALAKKALNEAISAKQDAQTATQKAQTASQKGEQAQQKSDRALDILTEEEDAGKPPATPKPAAVVASLQERVSAEAGYTDAERAVINALLSGEYIRRSLTGIVQETKLSPDAARQAVQSLLAKGAITQIESKRTGRYLYEPSLVPT
jgi:hypothetical protein